MKIKSLFLLILFGYLQAANGIETPLLLKNSAENSKKESELIAHVKSSIENAKQGISQLSQEVLEIPGMSSAKVRHLLNNLCQKDDVRYLEIGCWKGSTWISAMFGNENSVRHAVAIDNWSQFSGPEGEFLANCARFLPCFNFDYYSADCFSLKVEELFDEPVNIYFYDGEHSALSQELAFTYYNKVLDDLFIAIVDDWNWSKVREGTQEAFKKLGYQILYDISLPAKFAGDTENWWNGIYVAVIRKEKK